MSWTIAIIPVAVMTLALCGASPRAFAQSTPRFTEQNPGLIGGQAQTLAWLGKDGTPIQPGKSFSEIIPGNGTRAGYSFSHGGISPDTVRVSVGARSLYAGADYYVDPLSGSLAFTDPVSRFDSIRATYRYVEGQDGARSPVGGVTNFALNLKGTSLNFGFGLSSVNGLDFNTYGLAMSNRLSVGSSLTGLLYYSTPAASKNNLVGYGREALEASARR